jgi:glycosyltransferase involved in cell wall biosynthesis
MRIRPTSLDKAIDVADPESPSSELHVAILMGTYNGARFLSEQLASLARQKHRNWTLHVSDDGSVDNTLELLDAERSLWGNERLKVGQGPRRGFVANFLSLACSEEVQADCFAWCDQDDIWCDDKLEVALAWLKSIPEGTPALYCGRTEMICESGLYAGHSPLFTHPPHFANALVQSIAGGNTMVFNQAARVLMQEAGANLAVPSHDWWVYQLVSGAGGFIHYDPEPKVLYRQHDENLVGANSSWAARLLRMRMVFSGRFCEWNEQTVSALESMQHRLNIESRNTLGYFKSARNKALPGRVLDCFRSGIYRQTLLGNLGLILATLLKKI